MTCSETSLSICVLRRIEPILYVWGCLLLLVRDTKTLRLYWLNWLGITYTTVVTRWRAFDFLGPFFLWISSHTHTHTKSSVLPLCIITHQSKRLAVFYQRCTFLWWHILGLLIQIKLNLTIHGANVRRIQNSNWFSNVEHTFNTIQNLTINQLFIKQQCCSCYSKSYQKSIHISYKKLNWNFDQLSFNL